MTAGNGTSAVGPCLVQPPDDAANMVRAISPFEFKPSDDPGGGQHRRVGGWMLHGGVGR